MGAVWGDYDNDGYEDLLLIKWGKPELFHNDAGKGFTRVTEQAGLAAVGQREHRACGLTTMAMGCSISLSAAITPKMSTCGISIPPR